MKPTQTQLRVLRGLKLDEAKACIEYDPPTDIVWQHWPLVGLQERLRPATFHALLRNEWIERRDWGAVCAVIYGLSDAGRALAIDATAVFGPAGEGE